MCKIDFTLDAKTIQELQEFAKLLNKDISKILQEALEDYFAKAEQELLAKEKSQTNLSYDEFWDGVDV